MPKIQDAGADTTGSRSRRGRRRVATSLSEINVIPLVDVMLVLLIIFMVRDIPSIEEPGMMGDDDHMMSTKFCLL